MTPDDVLEFWLGPVREDGTVEPEVMKRWWAKDPQFDQSIRDRFGSTLQDAMQGRLDAWTQTPRGTVALVIVLDQFSRNIHRDDPRAFAADDAAQATTLAALERGGDQGLTPFERVFLYMPLMHAEDLELQQECVRLFEGLAEEAPPRLAEALQSNAQFARAHRDIVERFGRFPHRNAILGRPSTPEEIEFLKQPGSSF